MPTRSATRVVKPRPLTFAQRKKLANEQLVRAINAIDKDIATTATLEIVSEWLQLYPEMSQQLHERYAELELLKKKPEPTVTPAPVPIAGPDLDHHNPYAKPDPYKLLEWYGHDQFRAVIVSQTSKTLRDFVDAVQAREPGAKPASRSKKPDMVEFIVEHVAGPGN